MTNAKIVGKALGPGGPRCYCCRGTFGTKPSGIRARKLIAEGLVELEPELN